MKTLSVVIPSHRSWTFIDKCLEALIPELNWDRDEVIVVDSSCEPAPGSLLRRFDRVHWRFHDRRLYPGAARNIGSRESRGEWLAFLDSDVVVQKGWRSAIDELSQNAVAAGGPVDPAAPATSWGLARYWIEFGQFSTSNLPRLSWNIPSCNMVWKRSEFEETGGFPEDFRSADDLLFNYRSMKLRGRSFALLADMKVTHPAGGDRAQTEAHLRSVGFWSGRARRQGVRPSLGGSRIFLPVLFLYRFSQVWRRHLRHSHGSTGPSLFRHIVKGTIWWCLGFSKGIRAPEERADLSQE